MTTPGAMTDNRRFWALYEHLRDFHGVEAPVLSRARTVAHLEAIHDEYGDCG